MNAIVEARGLVKRYGSLEAVAGIDFDVRSGEFLGMLGPNGAGKSTTMRMIYRVTPVTEGSLKVFGMPVGDRDREIKAQLGVVPQMDNLDEELGVFDNLRLYGRYYGLSNADSRRRADDVLEFAELSSRKNAQVRELSGGMRRRLILARGLINEPRLLILDEPTTGLDPQVRLSLWDRLAQLKERGVTILLTTHYMDEAERLCDRLLVIDHGKIIAAGSPRELIEQHVTPEVIEARMNGDLEQVARRLGISMQKAVDRVSLYVQNGREALQTLEKEGVTLNGAYVRPGNLEDVFLKLTGRSLRDD